MALSDCSRQCVWLSYIFKECHLPSVLPVPIIGDNQGSIFIAQNPITEGRNKHIDLRYHIIRRYIDEKKIEVFF
jgi:hypothetical protein